MEKKTRKKSILLTTIVIVFITIMTIAIIIAISAYLMNVIKEKQYKENSEKQQAVENIKRENDEILFRIGNIYINKYGYVTTFNNSSAILLEGINLEDNQEKIQSSLFENLLNLYDVLTSSDLINKVSKIDVSDLENIEIYINSETKILQIGNFENLSTKFVWIHTLLEQEEGVPGTIVVKDINEVYFMEVYNKDNENG